MKLTGYEESILDEDRRNEIINELEKAVKYTEFVQGLHESSNKSLSLEECDNVIQKHAMVEQENKRLEAKFQLLLKYTGRDVVSTIQYIFELKGVVERIKEELTRNEEFFCTECGYGEKKLKKFLASIEGN